MSCYGLRKYCSHMHGLGALASQKWAFFPLLDRGASVQAWLIDMSKELGWIWTFGSSSKLLVALVSPSSMSVPLLKILECYREEKSGYWKGPEFGLSAAFCSLPLPLEEALQRIFHSCRWLATPPCLIFIYLSWQEVLPSCYHKSSYYNFNIFSPHPTPFSIKIENSWPSSSKSFKSFLCLKVIFKASSLGPALTILGAPSSSLHISPLPTV